METSTGLIYHDIEYCRILFDSLQIYGGVKLINGSHIVCNFLFPLKGNLKIPQNC